MDGWVTHRVGGGRPSRTQLFRHWAAEVHLCQTARTDIEIRMRADAEFPVVLTRQSSLRPGICVQHCNSSRPTEPKLAWPDQQRF